MTDPQIKYNLTDLLIDLEIESYEIIPKLPGETFRRLIAFEDSAGWIVAQPKFWIHIGDEVDYYADVDSRWFTSPERLREKFRGVMEDLKVFLRREGVMPHS